MAIDFLIFGLLLISLSINLLALGAFWVTPGLRTTANRFVINLLIVNIIGSIVLAPTLFLNSSSIISMTNVNNNKEILKNDGEFSSTTFIDNNDKKNLIENMLNISTTRTYYCNDSECERIIIKNDDMISTSSNIKNDHDNDPNSSDKIVIAEIEDEIESSAVEIIEEESNDNDESDDDVLNDEDHIFEDDYYDINEYNNNNDNNEIITRRCWSLDLAAALGALSVLLVVGDTWCAVTDPLRYHSRISGLKAWILIAITWFLGIFFGVLSALRDNAFNTIHNHDNYLRKRSNQKLANTLNDIFVNSDNNNDDVTLNSILNQQQMLGDDNIVTLQPNDLYNMIFSCIYFIVIILLPFGFVCGMYWRIFSEARENGLRMRQNGSSPLLQSALNLSTSTHHHQHNNNNNGNLTKDLMPAGGLTMKIDRRRSSEKDATRPLLMQVVPIHNNNNNNNHRGSLQPSNYCKADDIPEEDDEEIMKQDRNQNILLTLSTANEELRRNFSARQLSLMDSSHDLSDDDSLRKGIRQVHSTPDLQKSSQSHQMNNINSNHNHALQLPTVHVSPKALSYMTSIRHRLSNASSLFKYREESRAARISILVVIMFLISYLPYGLLVLLQGRLTNLFTNSTQISIFMVLMANISSPFIFAYRNKRVRRGVKRLFGLDARSRNDRQLHRGSGSSSIGGCLLRGGTKASINVKRSASKASTYSVNSCKYLTPHSVNNGTFLMEIEKCHHYLKNNNNINNNNNNNTIITTTAVPAVTTINIIETKLQDQERRSILKRVCDSSRKFGCATNSCAASDNEQTDV